MGGVEMLDRLRRDTKDVPFGDYLRGYIRDNSEELNFIHRGLSDIKAGSIRSWNEIKDELDIE